MAQRVLVCLLLFAFLLVPAVAGAVDTGAKPALPVLADPDTSAPDLWGYTWVRSSDPGGPTFGWIDITNRPGRVQVTGLTDDNVVGPFPMLFEFKYYWYTVNTFTIGSNGYIAFGNQPSAFAPPFAQLPAAGNPNNTVAACVGDLVLSGQAGAGGQCYYWTNGLDSLVVSFINVTEWEQTIIPANTHTFQIVLTKADSTILFQYGRQAGRYATTNNTRLCIGIENQTGQIGLNYTFSSIPPHAFMPDSGLAIRIQRTVNTGLQITDAGVVGVFDFENLGLVGKIGQPNTISATVRNFGTAPLNNVQVVYTITRTGQPTARDTVFVPSLAPSGQTVVTFNRPYTPAVAGSYVVNVTAFVSGDQGPSNNTKISELYATTFAPNQSTRVQFENGASGGSINWIGGGGVGVAFDLPTDVYPVKVETVIVNVAAITTQPMLVQILDGSTGFPTTVLAERSVTAAVGNNTIVFDSVNISSGRFFVGARGQMAFSYETSSPISNRSWEYTGGWAPYRSRDLQDVMIRVAVRQLPPITPLPGWNSQTSGVTTSLRSVDAVSTAGAWIGGASGVVLKTTNAGTTWVRVDSGRVGTGTVHNIDGLDAATAFLVTTTSSGGLIYKTTDGGVSWAQQFSQTGGFFDAIRMYDALNGIVIGDPVGGLWTILRTTNGGATWTRIATEPAQIGTESGYNNSLATIGTTHIWFGSNANRIYRSTNGGATWDTSRVAFAAITGIGFLDANIGVAVSSSSGNAAARTTDGGVTWTPVTIPGTGSGYGVTAVGVDFWVAKGSAVYRSTDRGVSWTSVYPSTVGTFNHMTMTRLGADVAGWAVSSTGGIASYFGTLTGVRQVDPAVPAAFVVEQNYPNPFNPSTTIRFALPREARVTVAVFDLLGRRVATLADEVKSAGQYEAVWNGRDGAGTAVSSGVYLCRIEGIAADGGSLFSAVRKMILMK